MSSVLTTIREFLGPPDPRSEREIEDDLDAEFAFHIEQLEAELIEQGVPPEHAPDLARARFGNQAKLKQRCRRIALEERTMLQRINTVLMIVVMLAVVGVSIQMYTTQRYNSLALQDITSQIATMRIDAAAEARGDAASPTVEQARVLVEGNVERAGWYPIEVHDGATYLHEIVQQAGGVGAEYIIELRRSGQRRGGAYHANAFLGDDPQRIVLRPGDEIRIVESDPSLYIYGGPEDTTEVPAGTWRQVDSNGQIIDGGYTMTVIGPDDVRNLQGVPLGSLVLKDHDLNLVLGFQGNTQGNTSRAGVGGGAQPHSRSQNLHISSGSQHGRLGRWQRSGDTMALNITPAVEAITEPLLFRYIDE